MTTGRRILTAPMFIFTQCTVGIGTLYQCAFKQVTLAMAGRDAGRN